MKKNVLLFGANSYIAKVFAKKHSNIFNIIKVYKTSKSKKVLSLDFNQPNELNAFSSKIKTKIDVVLFLQGINPSRGLMEMSNIHFQEMLQVNVITPTLLLKTLNKKLNTHAFILFFSSIAKKKGSYDPSYSAAKSAIDGLLQSLANSYPNARFNTISLGLVKNSPVFNQMTPDYRKKHSSKMYQSSFVNVNDVDSMIVELIKNQSINRADIAIDRGYLQ